MRIWAAGGILGASVVVKALCGVLIVKLFAVHLSIEDFGRVGQFMTLIAVLTTIAGGAQTHGLIRNLSALSDEPERRHRYLRVAVLIAVVSAVVIGGALILFRQRIALALVEETSYAGVLIPVAIGFVFAGQNNIQIAVLSSSEKLKELALSQSIGIVLGTAFLSVLTLRWGALGAIAGFAGLGFWNALVSGFFVMRLGLLRRRDLAPLFDMKIAADLLRYSLALTLAIAMMPGSQIYVRSLMAEAFGWREAGYWHAVLKLSDAILQVFGTLYNNYVLARLAKMPDFTIARPFLGKVASFVAVASLAIFSIVYLLRDIYIYIVLSSDYSGIAALMPYQFAGDICRLLAAIGSYYFLATKRLTLYVGLEVYCAIVFALAASYFMATLGPSAAVKAHLLTYASLLALLLVAYFIRTLKPAVPARSQPPPGL